MSRAVQDFDRIGLEVNALPSPRFDELKCVENKSEWGLLAVWCLDGQKPHQLVGPSPTATIYYLPKAKHYDIPDT